MKNMILEAMYEVIKESTEWGIEGKEYGHFVDGVVAMTEAMLNKVEIKEANMMNQLENFAKCNKLAREESEPIDEKYL